MGPIIAQISATLLPWLLWLIRILLIEGIVRAWFSRHWEFGVFGIGTLALSFYPLVLERLPRVRIPAFVQVMFAAVILFGSGYLGSLHNWYQEIWWWDDLTHFLAGAIFYLGAYSNLRALNQAGMDKLSYGLTIMLAFCVAITLGVIWEYAELIGNFIGGLLLHPEVMAESTRDLILDTLGALLGIVLARIYDQSFAPRKIA